MGLILGRRGRAVLRLPLCRATRIAAFLVGPYGLDFGPPGPCGSAPASVQGDAHCCFPCRALWGLILGCRGRTALRLPLCGAVYSIAFFAESAQRPAIAGRLRQNSGCGCFFKKRFSRFLHRLHKPASRASHSRQNRRTPGSFDGEPGRGRVEGRSLPRRGSIGFLTLSVPVRHGSFRHFLGRGQNFAFLAFSPRPNWPHLPLTLSGATAPCQRPLAGKNRGCVLLAIRFYLKQHGGGVPRGTPLSGRLSPKRRTLCPSGRGRQKARPRFLASLPRPGRPASQVLHSAKTSPHPEFLNPPKPAPSPAPPAGRCRRPRAAGGGGRARFSAASPLPLPTKRCLGWGNCRTPRLARQGAIAEKLSRATGGAGAKKRRPALGAARRGCFGLGLGPAPSQSSSAAEGRRFFSRLCRRF